MSMKYKAPHLTVDGIVLRNSEILLVQRKHPPFQHRWALPGGFVEYGETAEHAIVREVVEETGLNTTVEQLIGVYSDPKRDPRGHTVTIVYLLKLTGGTLHAGDDAQSATFFNTKQLPPLAFDHQKIIADTLRRM